MRVSRWFEPVRDAGTLGNRLRYKLYKGIVNVLYPMFGTRDYGLDETSDVIVSLTSYPARISTVHLTVRTLLTQTRRPGAVILWLAEDQFPGGRESLPKKLRELEEHGLTIRFCENLYPHKKYYFAMKEHPDKTVITVDDDCLYAETLIEELEETSARYPGAVCCTWGHRLRPDERGEISCENWEPELSGTAPSMLLAPTGVGGVLYPPHALADEVFDKEALRACALRGDDLWLKVMAVLKHTPAVRTDRPARVPFSILKTKKTGLFYGNAIREQGASEDHNTVMWRKLMERYPQCRTILRREAGISC